MKYLLDVNALLAWRHARAPQHLTFHTWAAREGMENFATCGMVELGFIRVSMQAFGYTLAQSESALVEIKKLLGGYVAEAPSPRLAGWAGTAAKTPDAYLVQVAGTRGLRLATFDGGIPGAALIS